MERQAEVDRIYTAHRDHYLQLAEQADKAWLTQGHEEWLARMRVEDGNLHAALEWSRSRPNDQDALARLITALREYWEFTGRFSEGSAWVDQVIAEREQVSAGVRVNLLISAGRFAAYFGDYAQAETFLDEALTLARAEGDAYGEANAISHLAYRAQTIGDTDASRALHMRALGLWQALGNADKITDALNGLGIADALSGDIAGSIAWFEQSLPLCRAGTNRYYLADCLLTLGFVRFLAGQTDVALPQLTEGLSMCQALEAQALIARGLEEFAFVAAIGGAAVRSARLLGAVETLRERIGVPRPPSYDHFYGQLIGALDSSLSAEQKEEALAAGRLLTGNEAVALALALP